MFESTQTSFENKKKMSKSPVTGVHFPAETKLSI